MKKIITTLLFAGASTVAALAQSFGAGNAAVPGDKIGYAYDTVSRAFPTFSTTGAGQTWDFSTFGRHNDDTTYFEDPSTTMDPPSDATLYDGELYWEVTSSSLSIYYPNMSSGTYKKIKMANLPMALGFSSEDSISDHMYMDTAMLGGMFPGVDSVKISFTINFKMQVDAGGSIILKAATYDALRHRMDIKTSSSVWIHHNVMGWQPMPGAPANESEDVTYSWWTDGFKWSVARINIDGNTDESTDIQYQDGNGPATGIGQNVITLANHCYPNPASGSLTVNIYNSNVNEFPVYDLNGSLVKTYTLQAGKNVLDISNLTPGMYFYQVNPGQMEKLLVH